MHRFVQILSKVTTEHGIYLCITGVSVVSAFVTMFVNTSGTVSVKWLIAIVCLSAIVMSILVRALIVACDAGNSQGPYVRVIRHIPEKAVLLIRSNLELPINSLLSVYIDKDGFEEFFSIAYVENVQDKNVACLRLLNQAPVDNLADVARIKTTLPYNQVFTQSES